MKPVRIIRIDPYRRTIAALKLKPVKDATPQIRRLIRANNTGSRLLMKIEEQPLMAVCGMDVDEAMNGWRLRGTEDSAGISILTGRDEVSNILIDVPVSCDWVRSRIQWLEGEDVGSREERAAEIVTALDDKVRAAMEAVIAMPGGEFWLTAAHRAIVGEAMQTLGLGTERSGGQLLTPLGESVHFAIIDAAA